MILLQNQQGTRAVLASTLMAVQSANANLTVVHDRILLYHEASRFIMMEMAMTIAVREKFSSQAAPEVLAALRRIAES